ncbi:MAG: hypothetical protein NW226_11470 [Microscillaceae bacterium]|nr:hypothetical protein [Microscillaceae bacterium]
MNEFIRVKTELIHTLRTEQKSRLEEVSTDDDTQNNLMENPLEETMAALEQSSRSLDRLALELDHLKKISASFKHEIVEPNALVVTDYGSFLIGVNQSKLIFEGQNYYGITTEAPLYQTIKDLKANDEFMLLQKKHKILAIY